jgi:hypothetical protein
MPRITVEITTNDLGGLGRRCPGARAAERALRRAGLISDVKPHRIRLYGGPTGVCREVETPGQLRRFMRLLDGGCQVPPPRITIDVPEGWEEGR